MPRIQEWIYQLEVGGWRNHIRLAAAILTLVGITVIYNLREFENFTSADAMEAAQVARNLATGQGYSTQSIRPLDLHVLGNQVSDTGAIFNEPIPDLSTPPVYPVMLAAFMKVLPFDYDSLGRGKFDSYKYQPEVLIGWINQSIFFASVVLVFLLGRKLWDVEVGVLAAAIFFGTEIMWRFSTSGLSTTLLIFLFLLVCFLVAHLDAHTAEEDAGVGKAMAYAVAIGFVFGLMILTRYSMLVMIVPVVVVAVLVGGAKRGAVAIAVVIVSALVMAPWLIRNHSLSGNLFGTAGYVMMSGTDAFPGDTLERSLDPDWGRVTFGDYTKKLMVQLGGVVSNDLPRAAGGWVGAFFLVGLLLPFRSHTLSRLRIFAILVLVVLVPAQCLVSTSRNGLSPEMHDANLLVLVAPLLILYGVSLFFMLLDRLDLPETGGARRVLAIVFALVMCVPLLIRFLPPRTFPVVERHYFPPRVQAVAGFLEPDEVMMTDMPWATAWYGGRRSVQKTLDPSESFDELNRYLFYQSVAVLYLTELTLDRQIVSELGFRQMRKGGAERPDWATFVFDILVNQEIPSNFDLRHSTGGYWPEQILLADYKRW